MHSLFHGCMTNSLKEHTGFGAMRGGGRVYNQLNFSSGSPTCSRHLPRIAENGNDSWDNSSFGDLKRARDHNDVKMFSSSTPLQIQVKLEDFVWAVVFVIPFAILFVSNKFSSLCFRITETSEIVAAATAV